MSKFKSYALELKNQYFDFVNLCNKNPKTRGGEYRMSIREDWKNIIEEIIIEANELGPYTFEVIYKLKKENKLWNKEVYVRALK